MGKMFFNILATFAEFEADLIRLRTREGMKIARAKGRLRGKQPKLSDKQQKELGRMHGTGQYSISDLAELFSIFRPTVYRTLLRSRECQTACSLNRVAFGFIAFGRLQYTANMRKVLLPLLVLGLSGSTRLASAACTPIPGAAQLWTNRSLKWVWVGEVHGSNESPAAFWQSRL